MTLKLPQHGFGRTDNVLSTTLAEKLQVGSLTIPRSMTQIRPSWPYFFSIAAMMLMTVVESWVLPANTS